MLDKDMREPLFDYLEESYGKVRTIEEKIIKKSRADVLAVIDEAIIGIEIKSDNDTYTRLKTQVKDYEKFCNYCFLAIGEKHKKHAAEHVPDYWGILVITEDNVEMLRDADVCPKVKLKNQLNLLWRPELAHIQSKYHFPKYTNKKRVEIYDYLIDKLGEEQLLHDLTDELFERDYTVFDKPRPHKRIKSDRSRAHVTNYVAPKRKRRKSR